MIGEVNSFGKGTGNVSCDIAGGEVGVGGNLKIDMSLSL